MGSSNQETGGGATLLAAPQTRRTTGMMRGKARGAVAATSHSTFTMTAEHGLHLRPSAMLVNVAGRFDRQIKSECNRSVADARSVMNVMIVGNCLHQAR
jgi:hypothetical protein